MWGIPMQKQDRQTASRQAEPRCWDTKAACTRVGLSSVRSLKGSAFGMTVKEEITYSPV